MELHQQYEESQNKIIVAMNIKEFSGGEKQILSEMKNELNETMTSLKKRCKYEPNSLDEKEIQELELTKNQKEIARKRFENKSYRQIGLELNMRTNDVFKAYEKILKKAKLHKERGYCSKLSDRELEVLKLLRQGKKRDEIAEKLEISPNTVKTYLKRIKTKGVTN